MNLAYTLRPGKFVLATLLLVSSVIAAYTPIATAKGKGIPYTETITSPAIVNYPNSIASTGDSITRAFNTGTIPFTDSLGNSWSTGTNSTVMSHYSRILANHQPMSGNNYNDAVTGAQMVDLNSQVQSAVTQGVAYVTILIGANDACTDTEAQMTPVAIYRAQFQTALHTVTAGLPDARIFVLSVPNVYNLWFILKDNSSARSAWSFYGICQSLLANPLSTAQADVDRRNRVKQRVIDYNTQLAEVCATSIHCKFDNNAAFNTDFVPGDVSTRDYFHPTIAGQAKIATVSYGATFDFREGVPPSTVAKLAKSVYSGSRLITMSALDNAGVAGIEYKINSGAWTRYTSPVSLPDGSSFTYRAVDVNGNIEEARTISPALVASP